MKKRILFLFFIFLIPFIKVNAEDINVSYRVHVQDIGWMNYVKNNELSGTIGQSKRIEAIKINVNGIDGDILYQVHVQDIGWMNYAKNSEQAGTIGQSKRIEAIRIKLTGELAEQYNIYYQVHVQDIGWMNYVKNNELAGSTGQSKRIEAMRIKLVEKSNNVSLKYNTHIRYNTSWESFVNNGEISGTTGQSKSIDGITLNLENDSKFDGNINYSVYNDTKGWSNYAISNTELVHQNFISAIKIKLSGELTNNYDIYYRSHVSNVGWLDWTKNDSISGAIGYFYSIEAIQIKILPKDSNEITVGTKASIQFENKLSYSTHVSKIGWTNYKNNGEVSGTTGQSKAIESLKINFDNNTNSRIAYTTYVRNKGWQKNSYNNSISGTTGQSLPIEAVQINIEGYLSNYYDIYYRVHVSNIGWLGWAKGTEYAGCINSNQQVEAIQIKMVLKGESAPGSTNNHFVSGRWDNNKYYDYFGNMATDFKFIDGIKYYFNSDGDMIGKNVKKVVDVSSWQGDIDWNQVKNNVDEAIIRVGWGMSYDDEAGTDSKFDYNIKEVQRLGIPYSIYIYGYAKCDRAANKEATFVRNMMHKYNIPNTTFVYYDAEINSIPLETYKVVIPTFINNMHNNGYPNVGVYGSLNNFISTNLNDKDIKLYPLWVAQYYKKIQYPGTYKGWQYTSDGSVPGINGRVDLSMFY